VYHSVLLLCSVSDHVGPSALNKFGFGFGLVLIVRGLVVDDGAVVRRRTRDQKVAGLTPGRGAIKSTRSTQPSIPPG